MPHPAILGQLRIFITEEDTCINFGRQVDCPESQADQESGSKDQPDLEGERVQ
jgi:hypothetical protein